MKVHNIHLFVLEVWHCSGACSYLHMHLRSWFKSKLEMLLSAGELWVEAEHLPQLVSDRSHAHAAPLCGLRAYPALPIHAQFLLSDESCVSNLQPHRLQEYYFHMVGTCASQEEFLMQGLPRLFAFVDGVTLVEGVPTGGVLRMQKTPPASQSVLVYFLRDPSKAVTAANAEAVVRFGLLRGNVQEFLLSVMSGVFQARVSHPCAHRTRPRPGQGIDLFPPAVRRSSLRPHLAPCRRCVH